MSSTSTAPVRPTDDLLGTALRDAAALCDARHDTAEANYLRSLAARLGSSAAPADETLYRAMRDGAALFAAVGDPADAARLRDLAEQLVAANPSVLPRHKPTWKDASVDAAPEAA